MLLTFAEAIQPGQAEFLGSQAPRTSRVTPVPQLAWGPRTMSKVLFITIIETCEHTCCGYLHIASVLLESHC